MSFQHSISIINDKLFEIDELKQIILNCTIFNIDIVNIIAAYYSPLDKPLFVEEYEFIMKINKYQQKTFYGYYNVDYGLKLDYESGKMILSLSSTQHNPNRLSGKIYLKNLNCEILLFDDAPVPLRFITSTKIEITKGFELDKKYKLSIKHHMLPSILFVEYYC